MENYILDAKGSDITPLFIGHEVCEPGHSFGPYIRDCYLVHFCLCGMGVLKNKDGVFQISAGQLFIIRPGEITTYVADMNDPWEYMWIAFRSEEKHFDSHISVFDIPHGLDDKLKEIISSEQHSREGCLAVIHELIWHSTHSEKNYVGDDKIHSIRRYIKYNYMLPITVNSISKIFLFDRSYLYRTFKARYGIGIKEYITSVRMQKGLEFLQSGYSVKESAHMVGYDDEFNFSKTFKAWHGYNPSCASEKIQENHRPYSERNPHNNDKRQE